MQGLRLKDLKSSELLNIYESKFRDMEVLFGDRIVLDVGLKALCLFDHDVRRGNDILGRRTLLKVHIVQ